jgi:CelD/BcsL family acetyltransferase involved in cellulose biosynthesis
VKLTPPLALLSPPDSAAWDALVDASDGASVFHTSAWASLWTSEWPGARWQAIVIPGPGGPAGITTYDAGLGAIVRDGPLGRRILAMPYSTYGGPLVRRGHADASGVRRLLLEGFANLARSGGVMLAELAWYEGQRDERPEGLAIGESFTHVRGLGPDFAVLQRVLPHSIRSRIQQGEEQGVTVRRVVDAAGVRDYHALAVRNVSRRGGQPKPLSVYQRVFETLVPAGLARYDLAEHEGTVVGGSLHFLHGGVGTNWLTVSDERQSKLRPNHLLIARVMKELCEAGYHEYNLGGSPPDATGLIQFKESWGATRHPVLELGHRSLVHRLLRG